MFWHMEFAHTNLNPNTFIFPQFAALPHAPKTTHMCYLQCCVLHLSRFMSHFFAMSISLYLHGLLLYEVEKEQKFNVILFILQYKYANYTNPNYRKTGKGSMKFQLIKQRSDISFALFTGGISNVCLFMSLSYGLHSVLSDLYILHAPNYIEQMHWLVRVSYILVCFKKKIDVL